MPGTSWCVWSRCWIRRIFRVAQWRGYP
jgi:hypothetical protein